jgi:colanic acid/amylovoran biosynthesis glycosyltransferase
MKIAFFMPSFPEISETFILRQITGLLDRGHDVSIMAHARADAAVTHADVTTYALLQRTRFLDTRWPGGRCVSLPATLAGMRAARGMLPVRSLRKTAAALYRVHTLRGVPPCDVVHCHYGDVGLVWGFAAPMWGAPLVVSFYGYDCSVVPRRFGEDVYRPLFRRATKVTALSGHMEQRLMELGCDPDRIVIQPLGLDPAAFSFRERAARGTDGPVRVLSVARLTEKKGLADALHALAAARAQIPLMYDIIGDGPLREPLAALVAELGIADVVRFRGALPQHDIVSAMHDADLFLLPSVVSRDGDEEGTPTVLIEAAATGLPVISTMHAGIPEIVAHDETGVLVPERSPAQLAAALIGLARAPERRVQMGRAARARVEDRFDTRRLSARLEAIYRGLAPDRT